MTGPRRAPTRPDGGSTSRRLLHAVRAIGNLLELTTPLGVAVARAGGARLHRGPRGLLLADGYGLLLPDATAFTVGNVLIRRGAWTGADSALLRHEERHSWQWLALGGLPFLPIYLLASGWSLLRTGDRGRGNPFERWAGLADGGYIAPPAP